MVLITHHPPITIMNELLRQLDRAVMLRAAYKRELVAKAKEYVDSLTDEQLLSGNF